MTAPASVAEVQSRIAAIQARFPAPATAQRTDRGAAFAAALAGAQTTDGLGYVLDPNATPFTPGPSPVASTGPTQAAGGGVDVIAAAKRYLGVPYLWGGTDPNKGLDCSGFVQRVYADLGIDLPRVSRDQARAGTAVASLAQARPGDLIAFGSPVDHIGIYVGDNKMIVAPRRGDVVKIQEVYRTPTAIRRIIDTPAAGASTAPGGTPGPAAYAGLFRAAESRHGLPAGLLNAVAKHESGYNPNAVSPAGARGLMQFMPATARELGIDPMVPSQAIDGAARYLSSNLRRFGSVELAVAAYNAGPGAVARHNGVPPYAETRTYVQRVLGTLRGARA